MSKIFKWVIIVTICLFGIISPALGVIILIISLSWWYFHSPVAKYYRRHAKHSYKCWHNRILAEEKSRE